MTTKTKSRVILTQGYKRGDPTKYVKVLPPVVEGEVYYTSTTDIKEATEFDDAEAWCKQHLWDRKIPHLIDGPAVDFGW